MKPSTAHIMTFDGIPVMIPNKTDDIDTGSPHWHISYNNRDVADYGSDTTAIVLGQSEYFIILNGDHRDGLRQAIDNKELFDTKLGVCLDYARNHRDQLNFRSDKLL